MIPRFIINGAEATTRGAEVLVHVPTFSSLRPDAATRVEAIAAKLKQAPVLIVGESEDFARSGGMVNFYLESSRVRFEINRRAAESVGVRLSSQLLRVARIVAGRDE